MGKWGGANAFLQGLQRGYEQGRRMRKDWDVASVLKEKPEEITGYTSADGEQLDAISKAVGPDGKPYYTIGNDDKGNYTVTPNFGDSPQQVVMQQGVRTAFMGKEYDGKQSEAQIEAIRQGRIADILTGYDPMEGARYRAEMQRGRLTDMQIKGAERQDRRDQRQDDIQSKMDAIDGEIGEYAKSLARVGEDGNLQDFAPADYYKLSQYKTKKLVDAGLLDQAQSAAQSSMKFFAESLQVDAKAREADANKAIAGIDAGDLSGVKEVYNKWLPNGYDITDIVPQKNGSFAIHRVNKATGEAAEPKIAPDKRSLAAGVLSIADGKALINLEQQKIENDFRQRQLANSEAQTGISAGHLNLSRQREARETAERKDVKDASAGIYIEQNPNATPAMIKAVRAGVLPAMPKPGEYKVDAGDVTTLLGTQATNDKGQPIMDMNGKPVVTRNPVNERQFFEYMERNGITDTNKGLAMFIAQQSRNSFKTEAEAEAAFKAGKIKPGQVVTVGGRTGTWR